MPYNAHNVKLTIIIMSLIFCIANKAVFYMDPFRIQKIKPAFSAGEAGGQALDTFPHALISL